MSAGFPTTKQDIDLRFGQAVVNLRECLDTALRLKAWIDMETDATLIERGYTQTEADLLQATAQDLATLTAVARGQQGTGTSDFFFNAKKLTGLS